MKSDEIFDPFFDYQAAIDFVKDKLGKGIGFPYELYENQRYALVEIFSAFSSGNYDNIIVVAPTGSGKSGIAVGAGLAASEQDCQSMILTPTRQLQKQVVDAFKDIKELRSFKGKGNYPCAVYEDEKARRPFRADTSPCNDYEVALDATLRLPSSFVVDPVKTDHADLDKRVTSNATEWLSLSDAEMEAEMSDYRPRHSDAWTGGHQMRLCSEKQLCPYRLARDEAQESPIAVLNLKGYFLWNTHAKESPYFKPRTFMIFDECHNIEDHARDFYALSVTDWGLNDLYKKVLGKSAQKYVDFRNPSPSFYKDLYELNRSALLSSMRSFGLTDRFEQYAELAAEMGDTSQAARLIKYHKIFKAVLDPRSNFAKAVIYPESPEGLKRELVNSLLEVTPVDLPISFREVYGTHNVFMSATIADINIFCKSVCLDKARTKIVTLPDTFPVEHRPIICRPVTEVNKKAIDANPLTVYKPLADTLEEIAEAYPNHRVLVHTSSYVFGQDLSKYLNYKPCNTRILCPHNGEQNKSDIAAYSDISDSTPYILVTPACREGYDFDGDLCRIQVFMKCPYPSLGDEVVKKKLEGPGGWGWYNAKTATGIRQMYGRSTRNAKDFSVTFFLDIKLIQFARKNKHLFPVEFHKAMLLGERIDWKKLEITTELSVDGEKISY